MITTKNHKVGKYIYESWYDSDGNFYIRMICESRLKFFKENALLDTFDIECMIRDIENTIDVILW